MLSIERDKCKRFLDRGGCDKGIEHVKAVRFCVCLEKSVGSRSNGFAERDDRIQRQETVDSRKFPFVSCTNNEFHRSNLRDRPRLWQRVDVFDCRRVAARNVNQNVAIDQERHTIRGAALESAVQFAAKPVYVFDAVSHVLAILPDAGERRIDN
jgi:hypothetical protein